MTEAAMTEAAMTEAAMTGSPPSVRRCALAGLAGALALAVAATGVGDLPATHALGDWARLFWPAGRPWPAMALAYLGLTLLVGAWWWLRAAVRDRPDGVSAVLRTTVLWSAPLLLAPPLQSRDLYSYLAQGVMFRQGIDPYRHGPAALGGPLAANVSPIWQHAAAPYGPLFLVVAAAVTALTAGHIVLAVIAMRLAMTAALAGAAACTVSLARRFGVDPADALWLAIANPLTLVHVVSGAHNDILIVALMAAGVLLAVRDRSLAAAVVIGLAILVKWPAGLALPVVVPAMARRLHGRWTTARAALAVGAVAGGTVLAVTWLMGSWYGWVAALSDTAKVRNGLSLTTDAGVVLDAGLRLLGVHDWSTVPVLRAAGLLAAVLLIPVLLLRYRGRPVYALGLALGALVVLGPVVHPWYLLWAIVPLAASARDGRLRAVLAWGSIGLVLYPMPWGEGFTTDLPLGALGVVGGIALLVLARRRPRGHDRSTGSGPVGLPEAAEV
jgi:hypothetical protein